MGSKQGKAMIKGVSSNNYLTHKFAEPRLKQYESDCALSSCAAQIDDLVTIFDILANQPMTWILWNQSKIKALQERVSHIHPLNFMEIISKHSELRTSFKKLVDSQGFVWQQCESKFAIDLLEQHQMGNLTPHVEVFAKKMQLDREKFNSFFEGNSIQESNLKQLMQECLSSVF